MVVHGRHRPTAHAAGGLLVVLASQREDNNGQELLESGLDVRGECTPPLGGDGDCQAVSQQLWGYEKNLPIKTCLIHLYLSCWCGDMRAVIHAE